MLGSTVICIRQLGQASRLGRVAFIGYYELTVVEFRVIPQK